MTTKLYLHLHRLAVDELDAAHDGPEDNRCLLAAVNDDVVTLPIDLDGAALALVDVHGLVNLDIIDLQVLLVLKELNIPLLSVQLHLGGFISGYRLPKGLGWLGFLLHQDDTAGLQRGVLVGLLVVGHLLQPLRHIGALAEGGCHDKLLSVRDEQSRPQ